MLGRRITQRQLIYAAWQGLDEAVTRLEWATGLRGTYTPLAEALYWCDVLDSHLRDRGWYESERAAHAGGHLVPGLRYARNFATHQMVALTETGEDFLHFPLYSGEGGSLFKTSFRWLSLEDLPDPGRRTRFTASQQECYSETLAGRDAEVTVRRAEMWFRRARDLELDFQPRSP